MSQHISSISLTSILTFLLCILNASALTKNPNDKLIMCVPRGLDPNRTKKYCQALEKITNASIPIRCVIAQDRLECARLILEGHADFARMNPSDLIILGNIDFGDTMIAGEIRYSPNDLFQYQVMLVARQEMIVDGSITLKGGNLCLPGYESDSAEDWTPFHARYLEMHHIPQQCQENLTSSENRAKATSAYITDACIPGPWRIENDFELKAKYPNLCSLCTHPGQCGEHDEYWGRRGALICMTDGRGGFSWARYNDIKGHFKTISKEELHNYALICPDGHWRMVDNPLGCQWINQPWPSILSHKSKAARATHLLAAAVGSENEEQANALDLHVPSQQRDILIRLLSLFGKTFEPFEDTTARLFLNEATGLWAAFSLLRADRCSKPIRLCVKSQIEMVKCRWMASAALVWTAGSPIECVIANPGEDCLDAVNSKVADAVITKPDQLYEASRKHKLKILLHEWKQVMVAGDPGVPTIGLVVKSSSRLREFSDLRGLKACIPKKYGFAWRAVEELFHKEKVFMSDCPQQDDSLSNYLKINVTNSDLSSLDCLSKGFQIAIVNLVNVSKQLNPDYTTICSLEKGIRIKINNESLCSSAWVSPGQIMIRQDEDPWRKDEIANTFEEISDIFSGDQSKKAIGAFNLYAPFDGKKNVLFHDTTVRLIRDDAHMVENAKTFWAFWEAPPFNDKMDECYISVKPTGSSSSLLPISFLLILLFLLIHLVK